MVSAARLQIYFFGAVVFLFQFATTTEPFNCDEKNVVYCLVKYLRANKGAEGRLKTEKGWQWVIKGNPSDKNDVNLQWKNWTTVENRTDTGGGRCVDLCSTINNDTSLQAGQDGEPQCSKLLCKLLSLSNCTDVTSETESSVEPISRNSEGEPSYVPENETISSASTLSYTTPHYTQPVSLSSEIDDIYSTVTESFNTTPDRYATGETSRTKSTPYATGETSRRESTPYATGETSRTKSTPYATGETSRRESTPYATGETSRRESTPTPTMKVLKTSIQLFGSSPMLSTEDVDIKTSDIISTTPENYNSSVMAKMRDVNTTLSPTDETQMYTTTGYNPKVSTQFVQLSTQPTFISTGNNNEGLFDYSTTKKPKPSTISNDLLTNKYTSSPTTYTQAETEERQRSPSYGTHSTSEDEGGKSTMTEDYPQSFDYEKEETPSITTPEYQDYQSSTSFNPDESVYKSSSERPQSTTESQFYPDNTSENSEEQNEVEGNNAWICVSQTKLLNLLVAYDEELRSNPCDCCSSEDRQNYLLGFVKWYDELSKFEPNELQEDMPKADDVMYRTKFRPVKNNRRHYMNIPEIDDKYVVKNTYSAKPRNNYHFGIPKTGYETKRRPLEEVAYYLRPGKKGYNSRRTYSFESSPIETEEYDNSGMRIMDYYAPELQKNSKINWHILDKPAKYKPVGKPPYYEEIEYPLMFDGIAKSSIYRDGKHNKPIYGQYKMDVDEEPIGQGDDGEFVSIYDKSINEEQIRNPFAQYDHRFIIIKDNERNRKISEDLLKKIHGRYKVQYVILDKSNHTRNVDLHKIFEEKNQKEEGLESPDFTIDQRMYKIDDNAIRDWFDKKYNVKQKRSSNGGLEKSEAPTENIESSKQPEENPGVTEENPVGPSLFSPEHQTQLRRRIDRNSYGHLQNELHLSKDGIYHVHLPDHVDSSIVEANPKKIFVPDKVSDYLVQNLVKRDALQPHNHRFHIPHHHKTPTRKQQNVKKNLNSFQQAYLQNPFTQLPHFGHNPKSEADLIAELQHSGGIGKARGWHSIHQHGVYPDLVGLQIVSDLQKMRKYEMLKENGKPFKIYSHKREVLETTLKTAATQQIESHTVPNREVVEEVHEHSQEKQQSNRNNNYKFYEVYPHSNYYSSIKK